MNILFPLQASGSGSDICTQSLTTGLNQHGISADIQKFSLAEGFFPRLAKKVTHSSHYSHIHANLWNASLFDDEKPLISTEFHVVHDPKLAPYSSLAQLLYYRYLYPREEAGLSVSDVVICPSRYTHKKIEEVFGYSDATIIPCGVDTSRYKPLRVNRSEWNIPENKTILLYCGNHSLRKGTDLLTPLMKRLGDDYLLIYTTGLRKNSFISGKNCRSLGILSPELMPTLYNLCDILVSPSRLEGFGLSVAEAMSCAKPVIAANGSALPELIREEKGGYLCRMNDISAFAQAVIHVSDDENLQSRMGRFNRERIINSFSLPQMITSHINLYQKL